MFSPILINSRTREIVPVAKFFDVQQFLRDIVDITDLGRGPAITKAMVALSAVRNFDRTKAPADFGLDQLRRLLADCFYRVAGSGPSWSERAYSYEDSWKLVMITPMSFQDLYNYDLATMSDSKTPVATQEGEITFLCIQRRSLAKDRGALAPDRELDRMESDAWPPSHLRQG